MNTRLLRLFAGAFAALALFSFRADGAITSTVTASAVSQYMFRGVCLGGPAFQPSAEVSNGTWGLGVWASTPIDNHKVPGQSNPEIDPYGYYTLAISDKISVVPGFTYYTYPNANTNNGFCKATFEPSVAVNFTVGSVTLTPKAYYDFVLDGPTFEFSASTTVPMKQIGTDLTFAATLGAYSWRDAIKGASPRITNDGSYFQVGVTAPFQVTKNSKLVVGFAFTGALDNTNSALGVPKTDNSLGVTHGVASLSYSVSF